jgi:hypothetical protein
LANLARLANFMKSVKNRIIHLIDVDAVFWVAVASSSGWSLVARALQ